MQLATVAMTGWSVGFVPLWVSLYHLKWVEKMRGLGLLVLKSPEAKRCGTCFFSWVERDWMEQRTADRRFPCLIWEEPIA